LYYFLYGISIKMPDRPIYGREEVMQRNSVKELNHQAREVQKKMNAYYARVAAEAANARWAAQEAQAAQAAQSAKKRRSRRKSRKNRSTKRRR
jgi:hypothetical protein